MTEWYLINPQPTLNSGFESNEFADYAQDGFNELLDETQLGKDIIFCKGQYDGEKFETEVKGKGIVQSETPDTYTQGWKRQLLTRIGDISDYKYIKYDGLIWLIMNEPSNNGIYEKCVLHQCVYTLQWQGETSKIYKYPASVENASQYNTGEEGNKVVMLGYNQLMLYISLDDITSLISRQLRIFIDYNKISPIPYKVTRPDTVSFSYGKSRVMNIVVTEDQYSPDTDNIELMLCDYRPIEPVETVSIQFSYSGESSIRIGRTKTFKTDSPVTFSLQAPSLFADMITLTQTDEHTCKITVENQDVITGMSFKLIADNGSNTNSLTIEIQGGV